MDRACWNLSEQEELARDQFLCLGAVLVILPGERKSRKIGFFD
jgi:hypothetical protein